MALESEQLRVADVQRLLRFEVQKAFGKNSFCEDYLAWQKATEVFRQAAEVSRVRFTDGDKAGYEQQRVTVAYLQKKNEKCTEAEENGTYKMVF